LASAASGLIGKGIAVAALLALQVPLKDIVLAVMP
jgi:3-hydroxyacyl-CoA dehydrogenase